MRTALIVLNLVVAAASAILFGYTFFARDHFIRLAQDFVIERTVQHVNPAVDLAEAVLEDPRAVARVPPAIREVAADEIRMYRQDPPRYVREVVAGGAAAAEGPKNPLAGQVVGWKKSITDYFEKTLASLIRDVRIFSGTNVVAALLAAWMAHRARGRWRYHVLAASALLLFALGLHIYMFIDNLTFFRIIFNWRVGWSYPVMIVLTFGYLYVRFGRFVPLVAEETPAPAGGKPGAAVR